MGKMLITGATGFIGKNLLELLIEKKEDLMVLSTKNVVDLEVLNRYGLSNSVLFEDDLCSKSDLKIDSCIHLASYGVRYGDSDIEKMVDVNIKLSAKVLYYCINHSCEVFLNVGSCFQYGSHNKQYLDESDLLKPEDLYAASKTACEILLQTIAEKNNLQFITVRPFSVFGKYEPSSRILPLVYSHGVDNIPLDMSGGEQIRDYLYVKDVANGLYQIVSFHDNFEMVDSVNLCSSCPCSIKEFVETVIRVKGFEPSLFRFGVLPYRKNESMRFIGGNNKLKTKTNWSQKYTLIEGIRDYVAWRDKE